MNPCPKCEGSGTLPLLDVRVGDVVHMLDDRVEKRTITHVQSSVVVLDMKIPVHDIKDLTLITPAASPLLDAYREAMKGLEDIRSDLGGPEPAVTSAWTTAHRILGPTSAALSGEDG